MIHLIRRKKLDYEKKFENIVILEKEIDITDPKFLSGIYYNLIGYLICSLLEKLYFKLGEDYIKKSIKTQIEKMKELIDNLKKQEFPEKEALIEGYESILKILNEIHSFSTN
ncbi:MAG: hypothetical protein ABIM49_02285 [candidate division WOR-3 bacterium]